MLQISRDNLRNKLDTLKVILELPKLHIANYFEDLRRDIDLSFFESGQAGPNTELNRHWSTIIEQLTEYEKECIASLNRWRKISIEDCDLLNLLDEKLNDSNLKQKTNQKHNLDKRIDSLLLERKRGLFLNKTAIFQYFS